MIESVEVKRAIERCKGEGWAVERIKRRRAFSGYRPQTFYRLRQCGDERIMDRAELLEFAGMSPAPLGEFSIGGDLYPGLSKLIEECGECGDVLPEMILTKLIGRVGQVAGKIIGNEGRPDHWDGSNLPERMADELDDLEAAILFMRQHNPCLDRVSNRVSVKLGLFNKWHRETHAKRKAAA